MECKLKLCLAAKVDIAKMNNKLFIVDDHKMLLTGLKYYLEKNTEWKVPHIFTTKRECLEKLSELSADVNKDNTSLPQIIIIDVQLCGESGFSLVQEISKLYKSIKCVMYSMYDTSGYIMQAKNCGAKGYISKVASEEELVKCLEIVQNGGVYIEEKMRKAQEKLNYVEPLLSKQEKRILEKLLQNKTNKQISEELFISVHTVEDYVSDLYDKCDAKNRAELIEKFM